MPKGSQELQIVPADDSRWTQNCVVTPTGSEPSLIDIVRAAVNNQAHVDNSDEEAGDDQYMVQFPGHNHELLEEDGVRARIRKLLSL